ncbi:hypothetical protein J4727_04165 [Providencia rettgeri]|uniref:Uncharacterized protein n=1 Tax=Providencia rettgeri TaxID=587 RepID=A0A939NGM5_PRORE|nr:hypothetical protein [Providencia rettgeri]
MIEQETSSAARKVSENAEKTMSESTELLKKMNEALRDIRDSKTHIPICNTRVIMSSTSLNLLANIQLSRVNNVGLINNLSLSGRCLD